MLGCTKPLDIKPQWDKPPVVVKCILERYDSIHKVELFYASKIYDDNFQPVEEAEVEITEENDETKKPKRFKFSKEKAGVWTAKFTVWPEKVYDLKIVMPGYDTISASATCPEELEKFCPCISKKECEKYASAYQEAGLQALSDDLFGPICGNLKRSGDHKKPQNDVYLWIRHSRGCDLATDHIYADDCNLTSRLYSANLFEPKDFSDVYEQYQKGIVPRCFGLPLHKGFLRIVNPVGYRGPFQFGTHYTSNNKVERCEMFDNAFAILGDFTYQDYNNRDDRLEMRVVSKELDRYYRDVYSYQNTRKDNIFNMIYSSANEISTNIKNGVGIFGVECTFTCTTYHPFWD